MSPFLSGSGTSNQRTRMLLEVVAKAETLVGPLEGTGNNKEIRGLDSLLFATYSKKSVIYAVYEGNYCTYGSKIEKDLLFVFAYAHRSFYYFGLVEKTLKNRALLLLGTHPWTACLIPNNLLEYGEKKSTGIPHLSPCVLNFLRLHS